MGTLAHIRIGLRWLATSSPSSPCLHPCRIAPPFPPPPVNTRAQPVNTGFSFSSDDRDRCYSEACVADDVLDFLGEFFRSRHGLALQGREFFVTGGWAFPALPTHIPRTHTHLC